MSALDRVHAALAGAASQDQRLLRLHTPLGPDVLLAERVHVLEAIGPGPLHPEAGSESDAADAAPTGLRLSVDALATDTTLELETLMGRPALVELLTQQSRSELRPFHAHVTAVALLGSDGGLARYRLTLEPWLAFLARRQDSWVFQNQSVMEIVEEVFADYQAQGQLAPAWRWDLADADVYPKRSLCIQYQESDLAFVQRLLQEEGLFTWWEHRGDATSPGLGSHTLVIADHNAAVKPGLQPRVRYTQSGAALPEDSLVRWRRHCRVQAGAVNLASRDYRSLSLRPASHGSSLAAAVPAQALQLSDLPGAYAYEDGAQAERLALRQLQALDAQRHRVWAAGSLRSAAAGSSLMLVDHPVHDGSDPLRDTFVLLAVSHHARNNLAADPKAGLLSLGQAIAADRAGRKSGTAALANAGDEPLYRCELLAQPLALPLRPGGIDAASSAGTTEYAVHPIEPQAAAKVPNEPADRIDPRLNPRPTAHGVQTAIVVGLDGPIHTEREHRIKIQFHWQRGTGSSHRLAHPGGQDNAPASDALGAWVRVAERAAGANWGSVFTPRVGQEVLVGFLGGDIDRPVVLGSLYNGQGQPDAQHNQVAAGAAGASGNAPAWFAGSRAQGKLQAHQHGAVLAGFKTQELASSASGSGGFNQLVFDDGAGQGRLELASTLAHTRLQLGHLLHQQDNQRLQPRGHGLDLASSAWGAVRAGAGLLLSADARPLSTASARQMDGREAVNQIEQSNALLHTLAQSAQQHQARGFTATGAEPDVVGAKAADKTRQLPNEQALYASADSLKATAQSGEPGQAQGDEHSIGGGTGTVTAWSRPDLVASSPAGIGLFTPADAAFSASNTATWVAGQDLQHSAQGQHATAVKAGIVLYTYGKAQTPIKPNTETGIALHAATGSVASHSLTAATHLTADQAVNVQSTQARVLVSAPRHVLLTAAGAAVRIEGGNITLTAPGNVLFKAGMKELASGAIASNPAPHLPRPGELQNWIEIAHRDALGLPMAGQRYKIFFAGNTVINGKLDGQGMARHSSVPEVAEHVEYEPRAPLPEQPWPALHELIQAVEKELG